MAVQREAAMRRLGVFNTDAAELEKSLMSMQVSTQKRAIPLPIATRGAGFATVAEYSRLISSWNFEIINPGDITKTVAEKKEEAHKLREPVQPYIILLGSLKRDVIKMLKRDVSRSVHAGNPPIVFLTPRATAALSTCRAC
ncbi:hypothetical protein ACJJTC_010505 [Scirpophaga incertulas]